MNPLREFTTRSKTSEFLESIGVVGQAAEHLLAAGAAGRHAHRVAVAKEAAMAAASEEAAPEWVTAVAWAICTIDAIGVFGRYEATVRLAAFRGCGKGRKLATDGDAWTAAIFDAANELRHSSFAIVPYAGGQLAVRRRADGADHFFVFSSELIPGRWVHEVLTRGLRQASGVCSINATWCGGLYTFAERRGCLEEEVVKEWADSLNDFYSGMGDEDLQSEIAEANEITFSRFQLPDEICVTGACGWLREHNFAGLAESLLNGETISVPMAAVREDDAAFAAALAIIRKLGSSCLKTQEFAY